jgi:hypothetical protein
VVFEGVAERLVYGEEGVMDWIGSEGAALTIVEDIADEVSALPEESNEVSKIGDFNVERA